jgi:hypothetical protein
MSTTDLYKYVSGETYTATKIAQPVSGTGIVDVYAPDGVTPVAFSDIKLYDDALGTTELVLDTDFTIPASGNDSRYSGLEGVPVYRKIQIINAAYQAAVFYADYDAVGAYVQYNPYPICSFYTQYPNADSNTLATAFPDAYRPADMFGGTWVAQWDDEGIDFHTERINDTGLQARADGLQPDQFQGHRFAQYYLGSFTATGAFQGGRGDRSDGASGFGTDAATGTISSIITDETNGTPRKGTVTVERNRLVRIYKRTA